MLENKNHIILFDGVCNLCNNSINFIIRHDKKNIFYFSALQSEFSKSFFLQKKISLNQPESIIYIENGEYYTQSTAALRIARHLNGLYPLLYVLILIPRVIRNGIYKYIAKNRYKWFGKTESCMVPVKSLEKRFLN